MVIRYRQVALDKAASPDELDRLPRLISPKMMIAVIVIVLLVLGTVIWGFMGRIPVKVDAMGTFLTLSGLQPVESLYSGELQEILVREGVEIVVDQIVAILRHTDLEEQINEDRETIENLIEQYEDKKRFGEENLRIHEQKILLDRLNYEMELEINKRHLVWLEEKRDNQEALWKRGLDIKGAYIAAKVDYENALNKNQQIRASLKQLNVETILKTTQLQQELNDLQRSIKTQRLLQRENQEKLWRQRTIRSQINGRVINISVETGHMVNPGDEILRVERKDELGDELICKLYAEPNYGSKIRPGMDVSITPFSVETGAYGNVRGFVSNVSTYTVNKDSMLRLLQNEMLVQNLSAKGAPYVVTVCLLPDPSTVSGLKWSTQKGAPVKIKAGTLCSANVVIENKSPGEFVMPFVRKKIFGIKTKKWMENDDS